MPSSAARPSGAIVRRCDGRRASRRPRRTPCPAAVSASGTANVTGIPLDSTLRAASTPMAHSAKASHREGRHSSRQAADAFDELGEFGIGGGVVSHEPVPELIVLGFQQT